MVCFVDLFNQLFFYLSIVSYFLSVYRSVQTPIWRYNCWSVLAISSIRKLIFGLSICLFVDNRCLPVCKSLHLTIFDPFVVSCCLPASLSFRSSLFVLFIVCCSSCLLSVVSLVYCQLLFACFWIFRTNFFRAVLTFFDLFVVNFCLSLFRSLWLTFFRSVCILPFASRTNFRESPKKQN